MDTLHELITDGKKYELYVELPQRDGKSWCHARYTKRFEPYQKYAKERREERVVLKEIYVFAAFYIGLDTLHELTTDGKKYELYVELPQRDGKTWCHARYRTFWVEGPAEKYKLHVEPGKYYRSNLHGKY